VSYQPETPFDNIESAHQYVDLLAEAIEEARADIEREVEYAAELPNAERRKEALLLVAYNLEKLGSHMTTSRRLLNDLRTLRRLLMEERLLPRTAAAKR
jgi:plasmid stabilization system protein ParE